MTRECETFYDQLKELREKYGENKTFLYITEAAKYCGVDFRTLQADKSFPVKKMGGRYRVNVINFARWLAK